MLDLPFGDIFGRALHPKQVDRIGILERVGGRLRASEFAEDRLIGEALIGLAIKEAGQVDAKQKNDGELLLRFVDRAGRSNRHAAEILACERECPQDLVELRDMVIASGCARSSSAIDRARRRCVTRDPEI